MHVVGVVFEVRVPASHSLKDKRAAITPVLEGLRRRYQAAAAEVNHQDTWQRAALGASLCGASPAHLDEVLGAVERFVWSFPELEVLDVAREWMEVPA